MKRYRQAGFGTVGAVLVIAVVLAVTIAAFFMMGYSDDAPMTKAADTSVPVPTAPEIKTTDGLAEAERTLDSTDMSADGTNTASQIDMQLNGF